jgi:hypothetical protein
LLSKERHQTVTGPNRPSREWPFPDPACCAMASGGGPVRFFRDHLSSQRGRCRKNPRRCRPMVQCLLRPNARYSEWIDIARGDPFDLRPQLRVALMPRQSFGRISEACQAVIECSLSRDCCAMPCRAVNEGDPRFSERSSSACAKSNPSRHGFEWEVKR